MLQLFCWGFTVDDAWIVSRVAAHGARSGIFSFQPGGPVTDAVTPIGFAHFLGYFGKALGYNQPLEFWNLARLLGAVSFLTSMALAGALVAKEQPPARWWLGGALSALCLPAAAWSGAGLATPIVGLCVMLGAWGLETKTPWKGGMALGAAIAWRPELGPFVVALCATRLRPSTKGWRPWAAVLGALVALPLVVLVTRLLSFGEFVPLAAIAKAPDLQSGLFYAAVTVIWGGLSWLILFKKGAWSEHWAVPWVAHLAALIYAGGDWMPALRLSAPLMPWLVWAVGRKLHWDLRFFLALAPAVGFVAALAFTQGEDWRRVAQRRLALIEGGAAHLPRSAPIAAVDIGWVGLATPGPIIDLAGVTDPTIARLPGGHTSKAVSPGLFSDRNVDTWVIRALDRSYEPGAALETVIAAYAVDARLLQRNEDLGFIGVATIPLGGTNGQYVVARRMSVAAYSGPNAPQLITGTDNASRYEDLVPSCP